MAERVGSALREEFGNLTSSSNGSAIHRVYLPGGQFVTTVSTQNPDVVQVGKLVGRLEGSAQLCVVLMREHAGKILGRYQLMPDGSVMVEYNIFADALTQRSLRFAVLAVHEMAVEAERLLRDAGALALDVNELLQNRDDDGET